MSITHGDGEMRSTLSGHFAIREQDGWHVSFLPARIFTFDQAVTAMVLAEHLAWIASGERTQPHTQRHIRNWLIELGIIVDQLSEPVSFTEVTLGGGR